MDNQALILLVDDEPNILNLYRLAFTDAGFQVATAGNGAEAIKITKQRNPSLILLDLKMPDMDGVDVEKALKSDPATKDIKVVFLTAFSDPVFPNIDRKAAETIGATDCINKETDINDIVAKVRGYLPA